MSKPKTYKTTKSNSSDIAVRVIEESKFNETYNNFLVLGLSGSKLNNVIMNTIRRSIMELVPTCAFDKKDINITKNTSIYNNDYMRLRISHLPVVGVENNFNTIDKSAELEYNANISTFEKKIEDLNVLEEKMRIENAEKSQNLIMNVNVKNNNPYDINVSTNDSNVKFYYQGKIIESPYKRELLIIKLKPGEEFRCVATSSLNIGLKSANFMPNAVCVFAEPASDSTSDSEYKLNLESLKQIPEKDIVVRACAIIEKKLDNFNDVIVSKINDYKSNSASDEYNLENKANDSDSEAENTTESAIRNAADDVLEIHRIKGIIKIENESHTFGNLLSRFLQDHPSITFAGYKIDHLLIKELTIGYKTDGTDIANIFTEVITEAKSIFTDIKNKVSQL